MLLVVLCPCKLVETALEVYHTENIPTPEEEEKEEEMEEKNQKEGKATSTKNVELKKDESNIEPTAEEDNDGDAVVPEKPAKEVCLR